MANKKRQHRTHPSEAESRPPMVSLDRVLTLAGFGVLIVLVVLIAPYFAHKQDLDFKNSAQEVLAELNLDTSKLLSPEAIKQLEALGAYPAEAIEAPFFQGGAKQGSVRTKIKTAEGLGLLSIGFLLKRELSLDSRWSAVSFCRPDQQGAVVAYDFLSALRAGNYATAYALSASGVAGLGKEVSLSAFEQEAKQWLSTHKGVLHALKTPLGMPQVAAKEAVLTASWPESGLSFLLLENPLQCAYVVQFTLQ